MRSTDPKLKSKVIVNLTVMRVRQRMVSERVSEKEKMLGGSTERTRDRWRSKDVRRDKRKQKQYVTAMTDTSKSVQWTLSDERGPSSVGRNNWNHFKASVEETSKRRGGLHYVDFYERIDTTLITTGLK